MVKDKFFSAIILSAGKSTRMGYNKMLLKIGNRTVFERTVEVFENCDAIDEIIIVAPKESITEYVEIIKNNFYSKVVRVTEGGETRQESVYNGLQNVSDKCDYIAVHDGARALIEEESIVEVCEAAIEYGGAVAAVTSVDTLKEIDSNGMIISTIDRDKTVQVRTPQIFKKEIILDAHAKARVDKFEGTDECMLVERCKKPIKTVITGKNNIKLTQPEDIFFMTSVLRERGKLS
ncbi:MAG: 2-C-methyl-D-erythritol 4-phosphate cytidylyltransferase [Clostridia bacterium]